MDIDQRIIENEAERWPETGGSAADRVTELPDDLRLHILTFLPYKSAVCTGALSAQWHGLWKQRFPYSSTLNLTATAGTPTKAFVAEANRQIEQLDARPLDAVRIAFRPRSIDVPVLRRWMENLAARRVADLHLDLSPNSPREPPKFVFAWDSDSLIRLTLRRCHLNRRRYYSGFTSLEVLALDEVHITDDAVQKLILRCPFLRVLELRRCRDLNRITAPPPYCRLTALTVADCPKVRAIDIHAPMLRSLHVCRLNLRDVNLRRVSALEDVCICMIWGSSPCRWGPAMARLGSVQVLTLGGIALQCFVHLNGKIKFDNLRGLRLLMKMIPNGNFCDIYPFFRACLFPCLEKIYIELPPPSKNLIHWEEHELPCFSCLEIIKMDGFHGNLNEMRFVEFFLGKATHLKSMILVARMVVRDDGVKLGYKNDLSTLYQQLQSFPKVSMNAEILLYEYDSSTRHPSPTQCEV